MFRAKLRLVASSLIKAVVVNILNNVFLCKFKTYAILVSQAVVVDSETIVFLCKIKACANLLNQALFIPVVSIVESIIYFFTVVAYIQVFSLMSVLGSQAIWNNFVFDCVDLSSFSLS